MEVVERALETVTSSIGTLEVAIKVTSVGLTPALVTQCDALRKRLCDIIQSSDGSDGAIAISSAACREVKEGPPVAGPEEKEELQPYRGACAGGEINADALVPVEKTNEHASSEARSFAGIWKRVRTKVRVIKAFEYKMDEDTLSTCVMAELSGQEPSEYAASQARRRQFRQVAQRSLIPSVISQYLSPGKQPPSSRYAAAKVIASESVVGVGNGDGVSTSASTSAGSAERAVEEKYDGGGGEDDEHVGKRDDNYHQRQLGMQLLVELEEQLMDAPAYMSHPASYKLGMWNLCMLVWVSYSALGVPFRLGFDTPTPCGLSAFDKLLDGIFLFDIVIGFTTGYYEGPERHLVMNPVAVARRYARSWLVVDAATSVPFDLIYWGGSGEFGLLKLLKLLKVGGRMAPPNGKAPVQ